jgi:AmiR/NasT family two-component response regulator
VTQVQLQRRSLPQILREMEIRSELANRERLAEEERNRQRELEQRRRIDRATAKLIESHRSTCSMPR